MERPIFYDASGRRNRWVVRTFLAGLFLLVVTAGVFAATVVDVPIPSALNLSMERPQPRPLSQKIGNTMASIKSWLPGGGTVAEHKVNQVKVGFYVPWDDASRASLIAHIKELEWLVPGLISVTGADHHMTVFPDHRLDALLAATPEPPAIVPMVQNILNGKWDGSGMAALLHDPKARAGLLDRLEPQLAARRAIGVMFDFEELPGAAQRDYLKFLNEAKQRYAAHHWLITLAVPVDNSDWNLGAYANVADRLVLMDYDEHTTDAEAGPIASQKWFVDHLKAALRAVPRSKAIVGVGSYSYDWTGNAKGDTGSVEDAWLAAHDSEARILFDKVSGNPTFSYEENGDTHTVWFLDAVSAWNQLRALHMEGVAGVALWRLGTEDPDVWKALAAFQTGKLPDLRRLRSQGAVDIEGNGEILRIEESPVDGSRTLSEDKVGLVIDEQYHALPTPYVIRRAGYQKGLVALSFDDGPDPEWTPQILDILKAKHVPATFFVIGENAMPHPFLLNRIVAEGSEIGNHSFTHPNLANVSAEGTRIELNSTNRLVEAYTGRSTRLFRAPYFGDAEPTTTNEIIPALVAQQDGYTNVGLHVDPSDWKRPGVAKIVKTALDQVQTDDPQTAGQIVLLHDGGGDRAQTVAALPAIIDGLRAKGYQFVPVSRLAGLSYDAVMPKVTGRDLLSVRADVGVFLFFGMIGYALNWLFFAVVMLGIGRAIVLAGLAWRSNRPKNRPSPPPIDPALFVSVLIPAFNEARVIAASVKRVLQSRNISLEVIVIDDGSKDETSAIVAGTFGGDPRVRLLTLKNGGKARALNEGLKLAKGEIIIALDADTQFEAETIAKLARWFVDPEIGAVAGNAKVGNRHNLVTRWQAVEYVTAQNLERRALSQFDAIMVVPGAVGAWRRSALAEVGDYPTDTLAEDQDLTIAIQRKGWRIGYDVDAIAWTEAPETFSALATQRFRWAFGTLQCLWKHRSILRTRKPEGLANIGIPQAWVFQIGFALVSPLIDLALVVSIVSTWLRVQQHGWDQTQSDVLRMAAYWIVFTCVDLICGWVAYRLEQREQRYPALLLVAQRFIYRQLMYTVVIRAVINAMRGPWVGWGKLERSGRVEATA
ncbi:polysaccharide deacetylase family protein [Aquisediminimonas profunda]|uniref:polysaccharide deacetylase family protein n=1 Tax=Aquisediminimonas profunda TaxID=1550733 RepID=UPI001C62E2EA|nr:glycosyltransferase [Aquisediminimonas profunda]